MTDIGTEMDALDEEAGSLIDDLFAEDNQAPPGNLIAPMVELADPDRGVTDGDPARGGMEFDLGLSGAQSEPDLLAVDGLDEMDREVGGLDAFEGVLDSYEQDP